MPDSLHSDSASYEAIIISLMRAACVKNVRAQVSLFSPASLNKVVEGKPISRQIT